MSDVFVADRNGKAYAKPGGGPYLFRSLSECKSFIRQQDNLRSHKPRVANPAECVDRNFISVLPSTGSSVPVTVAMGSDFGLVGVHEDLKQRRFAISSKCSSEYEFINEVAEAISQLPSVEESLLCIRFRELIPLVVDLCCKYRGYKADRVHESVLLVAGDLEMPSNIKPASD